jgi:hypothetical protein
MEIVMKLKLISSLLITASLYSVSMFTYAADVQFNNQSKYNLLLSEDNNTSPTIFLNSGTSITIDEESFKKICRHQPNQCKFYIFRKYDGNIATVTFQETTVSTISNTMNGVSVLGYNSTVIIKNI